MTGQFHWFEKDQRGEAPGHTSLRPDMTGRFHWFGRRPKSKSPPHTAPRPDMTGQFHWFGREPKRLGRQPKKDKRKMLFPFWSLCKK
jgi:hypothetical protein